MTGGGACRQINGTVIFFIEQNKLGDLAVVIETHGENMFLDNRREKGDVIGDFAIVIPVLLIEQGGNGRRAEQALDIVSVGNAKFDLCDFFRGRNGAGNTICTAASGKAQGNDGDDNDGNDGGGYHPIWVFCMGHEGIIILFLYFISTITESNGKKWVFPFLFPSF